MSASARSATVGLHQPRWLSAIESVRRPQGVMLLWGLAIGLLTALALLVVVPHESPMLGSRVAGMRASLAVLHEGGPLLVGRHGPTGAYYAVALNDDPGSFVYLPLLGRLLGDVSAPVVLSYCYMALVASLAAVYPLIFYRLTNSLLAGFLAPLMMVVCMLSIGEVDIEWVSAWGMLALLPLLYLLAQDWPRLGLVALIGISLAAGWLSSIRNGSGLGIVVIAAILLILRRWRWSRLLPALALLAVAYMATSSFLFTEIREHRDQRLGVKVMADDEVTRHPLWHTVYIGLGYLPNAYGLRYLDRYGAIRVQRDAPGTRYGSPKYDTVIRRATISFVRAHPLEAVRQYSAKVVVAVADMSPYLLVISLTMPAMLLLGPGRRIRRLWVLITIPAVAIGFLQPVIAIPGREYNAELFGVLGLLSILGCCWALEHAETWARQRGGMSISIRDLRAAFSHTWRDPLGRSIRISAIAITTLVLVGTGGYFIRREAYRWQGSSPSFLMRYIGSVRDEG